MKLALAVGFLAVGLIIVNVVNYLQTQTIDNLRKDINRVSTVQVRCAGKPNYSQCIDRELERWWNK